MDEGIFDGYPHVEVTDYLHAGALLMGWYSVNFFKKIFYIADISSVHVHAESQQG